MDSSYIDYFKKFSFPKRKHLLPWWFKAFTYVFIALGIVAILGLVLGVLGFSFPVTLYGIETDEPISLIGVLLFVLFIFKGFTAFIILRGRSWAIPLAELDAIVGISLCLCSLIILPYVGIHQKSAILTIPQFLLLIIYIVNIEKIKTTWNIASY
ncbi:hypothetical protein ACG2LH_08755 [Zhouia sp. PK063]|uniref:hypothetical protein n=1 Tax=Zhouia sp. PK063 TaxID=3373602 RepID=UPI00379C5431